MKQRGQHAFQFRGPLRQFCVIFGLYTLTQLRYDLRKMKGHGLLERDASRSSYRLTEKGKRVAAMFVLFHQRICGPLANSLFHHRPQQTAKPPAKIETAYHNADGYSEAYRYPRGIEKLTAASNQPHPSNPIRKLIAG